MRPLYAIAPLALILVLIGPTPHEANQAISEFKSRFMAPKMPQRVEVSHEPALNKPGLAGLGNTFNATHTTGGVLAEASFRR